MMMVKKIIVTIVCLVLITSADTSLNATKRRSTAGTIELERAIDEEPERYSTDGDGGTGGTSNISDEAPIIRVSEPPTVLPPQDPIAVVVQELPVESPVLLQPNRMSTLSFDAIDHGSVESNGDYIAPSARMKLLSPVIIDHGPALETKQAAQKDESEKQHAAQEVPNDYIYESATEELKAHSDELRDLTFLKRKYAEGNVTIPQDVHDRLQELKTKIDTFANGGGKALRAKGKAALAVLQTKAQSVIELTAEQAQQDALLSKRLVRLRNFFANTEKSIFDREVQAILKGPKDKINDALQKRLKKLQRLGITAQNKRQEKITIEELTAQKAAIAQLTADHAQNPAAAEAAENAMNEFLASIDKNSTPQGSRYRRMIVWLSRSKDYATYKKERAFYKQIKHLGIDYLLSNAVPEQEDLENFSSKTAAEKKAVADTAVQRFDDFFKTLQQPASPAQEALVEEIRTHIRKSIENFKGEPEDFSGAATMLNPSLMLKWKLAPLKKKINTTIMLAAAVTVIIGVLVATHGAAIIIPAVVGATSGTAMLKKGADLVTGGKISKTIATTFPDYDESKKKVENAVSKIITIPGAGAAVTAATDVGALAVAGGLHVYHKIRPEAAPEAQAKAIVLRSTAARERIINQQIAAQDKAAIARVATEKTKAPDTKGLTDGSE